MLTPLGLAGHAVIASNYLAGVTPGDYAVYTPVKAVYQSNFPVSPEPQYLLDFNHTTTATFAVQAVSDPARNVTLQQLFTFNNGTLPRASTLIIDLQTSDGNATDQ